MKQLKSLLAMTFFAFSAPLFAKGVMMDMFEMNRQMTALIQSSDTASFSASAQKFIQVAEKAQNTMPASLGDDQEEFKGYQQGMQEVIDVVKNADELAQAGKLSEAKEVIGRLNELKKQYHKQYK